MKKNKYLKMMARINKGYKKNIKYVGGNKFIYNKPKIKQIKIKSIETPNIDLTTIEVLPFEPIKPKPIKPKPIETIKPKPIIRDWFPEPINDKEPKESDLFNKALNLIDNAVKGILLDFDGNITHDIRPQLQKAQNLIDEVEWKRIRANSKVDVRISKQDIKAVLFKPIITMPLDNNDAITGRSIFSTWWKIPKTSLYDELDKLTVDNIKRFIEYTKNRIDSFQINVFDFLNDPKEFIDKLLDSIPTAFGPPS